MSKSDFLIDISMKGLNRLFNYDYLVIQKIGKIKTICFIVDKSFVIGITLFFNSMGSLLVKHIHTLVTMDEQRREIQDGALLVHANVIQQVGTTAELDSLETDEILDLQNRYIVLPGLINTHHHFYQTLTRAVPAAQDCDLFNWLQTLYPMWANLTSDAIYASAQMAAAELMLSGCTTSSDHLYVFPNDCTLDDEIRGVQDIGLRFHASRGSMSVGESQGGLPPDSLVEAEADILKDSQRLI